MIKEPTPGLEQSRELIEEQGHNTSVHFTFVRHSQKSSGQVFAEGGKGISRSSISEGGRQRAEVYGRDQMSSRRINKAYATKVDRTKETLNYAFQAAEINPDILQKSDSSQSFFSLPALSGSTEFNRRYDAIMLPERQKFIDGHYPGRQFSELTPDEQEVAAEYAEEPALEWYLSYNNERPDEETPSPREQAASVAFKLNRLVNLTDFMPNGKELDLVSSGHKTSTEALLKYIIERQENGEVVVGFESLEQIGGSLKILDSWDLYVQNDEGGEKHIMMVLRRENGETQEYGLNSSILNELAKEYIEASSLKPKKIDSLQ
ncbi:MAG: hypothetical protein WCT33_01235 [Patescibacteria group bacterium]